MVEYQSYNIPCKTHTTDRVMGRTRGVLLPLLLTQARALTFTIDGKETRCVGESIPAMSLLTGDWHLHAANGSHSVTTILSPSEKVIFEKHDATGHFAVTAQHEGLHRVCVHNNETSKRDVTITIKTALEVTDHASVAKKEHVEAIEAELDRMKKMAVHVYEEMLYMRTRNEAMQVRHEPHSRRTCRARVRCCCVTDPVPSPLLLATASP